MNQLEALFQQGRYREVFDQSRGSSDLQVLLIHANAALELGEGSAAREVLENLPSFSDPELEARRLFLLGWAHRLLGNQDSYRLLVRQAAQLHQGFPILLHLAYTLPPDEATMVLKEALARATNPREEAQAANALAMLFEPLGRLREGFAYASQAYRHAPDDPMVAIVYVTLALWGGEAVALKDLVGILEPIAASSELVHQVRSNNLRADLCRLLGQPHKALEAVEENIRLVGKNHLAIICVVAVRTYLALGMKDRALSLIQAAQLAPMPFARAQGQLQLALGMVLFPNPEAEEPLAEAVRIYGDEVPLVNLIARVYLAELRQEPLDQATLNQLTQWSSHALQLFPPVLRAARKGGYQLRVLGSARLEGPHGPIPLSPRSLEMLVLLLSRPQGWSREELCGALYGDRRSSNFKADIYRLKKVLGPVVQPRPWRITQPIHADFTEVRYWLERGELAFAIRAYKGPLLPHSQVPAIEELRHQLEENLRQSVLNSRDPDRMFALGAVLTDDLELLERLLEATPPADWRSAVVLSRLKRLRLEY
jgi:tetratricopeptide (TPR) repeat protein